MACVAAVFTIRALRSFEFTRQQSISAARLRVQEEEARRDTLRRQFLQRIVEMHRGRVRVVSEPNKGSTFIIELPAAAKG